MLKESEDITHPSPERRYPERDSSGRFVPPLILVLSVSSP